MQDAGIFDLPDPLPRTWCHGRGPLASRITRDGALCPPRPRTGALVVGATDRPTARSRPAVRPTRARPAASPARCGQGRPAGPAHGRASGPARSTLRTDWPGSTVRRRATLRSTSISESRRRKGRRCRRAGWPPRRSRRGNSHRLRDFHRRPPGKDVLRGGGCRCECPGADAACRLSVETPEGGRLAGLG